MEIELVEEKTNTEKRVLFKYDCVPYYSFVQSETQEMSGKEWQKKNSATF